jgi:predicted Zn finger-like uncharacterized protein
MNIVCKQCNAAYKVPDSKVPDKKATAKCKRCGGSIVIEPGSVPLRERRPEAPANSSLFNPDSGSRPATHARQLLADYPEVQSYSPRHFDFGAILIENKKGGFKNRRNKFKLRILGAVREVLPRILADGERVMRVAWATAYHPAEIFFGNGWLTMLYNRYALVATDRRLLMINTDHRIKKATHYLFQMSFAAIGKISRGLFRTSLVLNRKKGKRRIFTSMKSYLSAEMAAFIDSRRDPAATAPVDAEPKDRLCPSCFEPLADRLEACPSCQARFKTARKAALRSLLLPGWGDLYLGHRFLGVLELLGSCLVWMIILNLLLSDPAAGAISGLFLLLLVNGMDAALTRHMARKGYMLENRQPPAMAGTMQTAAGSA